MKVKKIDVLGNIQIGFNQEMLCPEPDKVSTIDYSGYFDLKITLEVTGEVLQGEFK